ncbi:MAG: UDP-2,3-diacylglucosamine diphosphatase [Weeksellaceae bacterium]|nr:UDP-2,3-diacylglucosamine diphosphatase [Weeksellaceae bacterium]
MAGSGQHIIELRTGKKAFFLSDQHFGAPDRESSRLREKKFLNFLEEIREQAQVIFLLGDLFDFWFEYRNVVPKGYVRILGKLAELQDAGVEIHFFIGNHDLWMNTYFQEELQIPTYRRPQNFLINGKEFLIGHGDGLGPGDKGYKRLKKLFTNPLANWLYRALHPDVGVWLGTYMSRRNQMMAGDVEDDYLGEEKEWLVQYCHHKQSQKAYDYFVFGHRHLPLEIPINDAMYINTGDWVKHFTYAEFDGLEMLLKKYHQS